MAAKRVATYMRVGTPEQITGQKRPEDLLDNFSTRAPIMTAPLRCAIYIRVSTAEQAMEGVSLPAQKAALSKAATARGWKVAGVYADEGKSARKRLRDRKEIFRLLDDVRAGLIDVIIFKEIDRWFRSLEDFFKVQSVLNEHGVFWVSAEQPTLNMHTKEGRLQVNILLSVAQNESDSTSDRIRYTNKYLRSQRRWTGGARTLPRCYTTDAEKHVVIDKAQEPFCRLLIDRFQETGSLRGALYEANETFEQNMRYNNAKRLIVNPMLYGEYDGDPEFVAEPFMSKGDWEFMQTLIVRNARVNEDQTYIFSGLVRCEECGTSMAGGCSVRKVKSAPDGKKVYKYYRCHRAAVQLDCSQRLRINEERLEQELLVYVQQALAGKIAKIRAEQQARAARPKRKSNREAIERQLDKLEDLYISSERMTKERYEEKKAAILAQLVDDTEEQVEEQGLANLEKIQSLFDTQDIPAIYADLSLEERRRFWRGIVQTIYIEFGQIADVDFLE